MTMPGQTPPAVLQASQGGGISPMAMQMVAQALMQGQGGQQPQGQGAFPGMQVPAMGAGIQTPGLAFGQR